MVACISLHCLFSFLCLTFGQVFEYYRERKGGSGWLGENVPFSKHFSVNGNFFPLRKEEQCVKLQGLLEVGNGFLKVCRFFVFWHNLGGATEGKGLN